MKTLRVHDIESDTYHEFVGITNDKRVVMKSEKYGHTSNTFDLTEILFDEVFEEFEKLQLECDGLTKVLSHILTKHEIKHFVHTGHLSGPRGSIIHFWIELEEDGRYIDYRARMWQGELAPHGVFNSSGKTTALVTYTSLKKEIWEVPEIIFTILTHQYGNE